MVVELKAAAPTALQILTVCMQHPKGELALPIQKYDKLAYGHVRSERRLEGWRS